MRDGERRGGNEQRRDRLCVALLIADCSFSLLSFHFVSLTLTDRHFSRRNRNAAWILTYPRSRRPNIDEPLRPMSQREMQAMEAEVLAQQMMQELEADGKVTLPNGEVHQRPEA